LSDSETVQNNTNDLIINHTVDIVRSMIGPGNGLARGDVPAAIKEIYAVLIGLTAVAPAEPEKTKQEPAVPIRKSVTPDFIYCLEDGQKFKSLKRHLRTKYNMSPEQYREKWGLPADYPMVAPNYSVTRSQLAKDNGLGKKPPA
jgi:predicted transcriptional regulator